MKKLEYTDLSPGDLFLYTYNKPWCGSSDVWIFMFLRLEDSRALFIDLKRSVIEYDLLYNNPNLKLVALAKI